MRIILSYLATDDARAYGLASFHSMDSHLLASPEDGESRSDRRDVPYVEKVGKGSARDDNSAAAFDLGG